MKCRNCGYVYSEMTNFCPYCGADQRSSAGGQGNFSPRLEPEKSPIDNFPGKPPKKKKHILRTVGIIIVVLLLAGNIGRLRRVGKAVQGTEESSSGNTAGQGFSGSTADLESGVLPDTNAVAGNNTESIADTAAETAETSGAADAGTSSLSDSTGATVSEKEAASSDDAAVPSAEEASGSVSDSTDSVVDPALVTPEFKEMMDSYEAWFDTYIEFMTEYKNSKNPADMMLQYAKFLAEYAEMIEKIDSVDEEELSAADLAYYMEVTARIYRKLATIQ